MRNRSLFLVFVLLLILVFGCDVTDPTEPTRELSSAEKELIEADNSFGIKLFKGLNGEEPESNIFISPLSISMALGMTYNGAAGSTEEAMRTTLEFVNLSGDEINESYKSLIELLEGIDSDVEFNIANSIWYRDDRTFEQDFFNRCGDYFDARVSGLDFGKPQEAKDTMDNWVDENTNGKIEEIVDYVDPINDMMFLINAIYFNGTWTYRFDEEDTKDEPFYLSGGGTKECKMMEVLSEFKCFKDSNTQVIDIPYGDGNYSMTAVIPYYGEDIDQMITGLTREKWDEWINSLSEDSVNLFLPKLKLEYKVDIAFDPLEADFTGMYAPGDVYISRIIHKTFLELDEEGTEAAAATVVAMTLGSSEGSYPEIRLNRPFLFAIRESHSGAILFIGKIIEPVWE